MVTIHGEPVALGIKNISIAAGQDLTTVDFPVDVPCSISGMVTDPDKQPVAGLWVILVQKTYQGGKTAYGQADGTNTDAKGRYKLSMGVKPGRAYTVQAKPMRREIPAISPAPTDADKRKPVLLPTYYPNDAFPGGGQTITLRSGQNLEDVNIQMAPAKSYCVQGVMQAEGAPAALDFEINESQPANGSAGLNGGAFALRPPHGATGPDGKFRICDLHPGEYILRATGTGTGGTLALPGLYAAVPLVISDRDVADLRVNALPGMRLSGEVVWDGEAPAQAPDARLLIRVSPVSLNRNLVQASSSLPGRFTLEHLYVEDYSMQVFGAPPGFYVEDVTYGGVSVLHTIFTPGSALGGVGLKVVVAGDGGTLSANVADKDGNPVQAASVCFLPAEAGTPAELETVFLCSTTDAAGSASSGTLPPGKYRVLATAGRVDHSAASVDKLWGGRLNGQEVELAPKGATQISLQPIPLY